MSTVLCGNASDSIYLTFKGGCRKELSIEDAYRCTGCGGRFHKDCIMEHFKLEAHHDWGRQRGYIEGLAQAKAIVLKRTEIPPGAKNPTRDAVVLLGEEITGLIQTDINSIEKSLEHLYGRQ